MLWAIPGGWPTRPVRLRRPSAQRRSAFNQATSAPGWRSGTCGPTSFRRLGRPGLPSRRQAGKGRKKSEMRCGWSGLPLAGGETDPQDVGSGGPETRERLWLDPAAAALWLAAPAALGKPIPTWPMNCAGGAISTLEPQPESPGRWLAPGGRGPRPTLVPLLQPRDDRRRLEESGHPAAPQVAVAASGRVLEPAWIGVQAWAPAPTAGAPLGLLATRLRPGCGLVTILSGLVYASCAAASARKPTGLDPLLTAWQQALGPGKASCAWAEEEIGALGTATHPLRAKRVAGGSPRPGLPGARHTARGRLSSGSALQPAGPRPILSLKFAGGGGLGGW